MTIETILSRLHPAQAFRVRREHIPDDRWRLVSRCVTCDEPWYRLLGLVQFGCSARRAAERTLSDYRPEPATFFEAVTVNLSPPWPVVRDTAPAAPPMRAATADPMCGPRPHTGDGHTSDTATGGHVWAGAFGGYRRGGPHSRPGADATDTTVELPVLVAS
ncbi:hypothetical protein [Stackebrandtia nassauensis]|uniref:hypothetical protein n=1 Tax=Stackebrandtia nassauensis TaxID=283811 RepID=UPI0011869174|nr:hypothetical protein [Stackebrandtia nassauensis]